MSKRTLLTVLIWLSVVVTAIWANNAKSPLIAVIGSIGTIGAIVAMWFLFQPQGIHALQKNVCKELKRRGYNYSIEEDVLFVKRNDAVFETRFWDTANRNIRRLYFVYDFKDDNMDKVSREGWSFAANLINSHNPHITFTSYDDSFACRFETAIKSPKDFFVEFDLAYKMIGEAVDDLQKLYPHIEKDYPNTISDNKASIGFK